MLNQLSFTGRITFVQKIKSFDYWLLVCILSLGLISGLTMYSSEGGQILYYTESHIVRFTVFFFINVGFIFCSSQVLACYWLFIFCNCYGFVILCFFIWYNSLRFTEMDKFIFYQFTTIGTNEDCNYSLFCKILSQTPN